MINLILGNCKEKLKELKDNSIDSCVCDPPACIQFMLNDFDDLKYKWKIFKEIPQEWIDDVSKEKY